MEKKKKFLLTYILVGIIFGALFPISAYFYEFISHKMNFSIANLIELHRHNNLLYMIDTAPIFLGIFSFIAGINHCKTFKINKELEITRDDLIESEKKLKKALESVKEKNKELYFESLHDKLTGVANEKSFIKNFSETQEHAVLMCINICHFREINTIFGYEVGDYILKEFATRLIENNFECYRIHGDEFAIVSYEKANYIEIDILANYIFNLISEEPFKIKDENIFLTIHMGISIMNKENDKLLDITEGLYNANYALKYAKDKNLQYALYNNEMINNSYNYSYEWKKKIILAIKDDKIMTFYQPIINNMTLEMDKLETLIRMKDEVGNIVSPFKFLTSAKKYGLYNHLTKFVITEALRTILTLNKEISINISIDDIRNISTMKLLEHELNNFPKDKTGKIVFELLESEGIENYDEVRDFISLVKSYGSKIAIDDFGSGYSNFSHIINLDIDFIKIDASLIKNIDKDRNSEFIVKLIVDFAKKTDIKTIAEFVHSKEVYDKVKELGIDYSQGYYFSEPKEISAFL